MTLRRIGFAKEQQGLYPLELDSSFLNHNSCSVSHLCNQAVIKHTLSKDLICYYRFGHLSISILQLTKLVCTVCPLAKQ